MTIEIGWGAISTNDNGETQDLGAGWATESDARADLAEQGCDFSRVEIYPAVTEDNWTTWDIHE